MYFDQGNIQCWKDQCEKQRKELTELNAQLADQRKRDRFEAACAVLQGLMSNTYYMERWSKQEDDVKLSIETADALLAELDRREAQDAS